MTTTTMPGALVVSLDFELHWGMRDHTDRSAAGYGRLAASRASVVEQAELFARRGVRATWATVGLLFASTAEEALLHRPALRPSYATPGLDPYDEPLGPDEAADPEHLAGSLVRRLAGTPGQEVASHTFGHYYCLEAGQTEAEFRADLAAARSIAEATGVGVTSLVLPRNQWNPAYARAVLDSGFTCIRGPQPSWSHRARPHGGHRVVDRAGRLLDTYGGTAPPPTTAWDDVRRDDGLCDVPASAFLRPFSPGRRHLVGLQRRRLVAGLRDAARRGRLFHLWWHPHNVTAHPTEAYALLEALLDEADDLARTEGLRSLSMGDVARAATTGELPEGSAAPAARPDAGTRR